MVVLYHSNMYWWAASQNLPFSEVLHLFGSQGVNLFFVLSGFLLFLPYIQALLFEKKWPQARLFYMRRILRIVPGYYFYLFLAILLTQGSYSAPHNAGNLFLFLTFLMPKRLAFSLNAVLWTLAVEFQYYLLLPLIALGILGLTRLVSRRRRIWVMIAALGVMVAWGMATRVWGQMLFQRPDYRAYLASHLLLKIFAFLAYGSSPMDGGKYLEVFAVGMLLALCYSVVTNTTRGAIYRRLLQRLSPWVWVLGLALLGCAAARNCANVTWCVATVPVIPFAAYPGWALDFTFALGFGLCILAILFNSGLLERFFAWTPLRWIGLISFSMYLWQFVFINFLEGGFDPYLRLHFNKPVAIGIFIVVQWTLMLSGSFALYVLVERPGMRLSDRLRKKMLPRETQKVSVSSIETSIQVPAFDDEKTEPRQPVARVELQHR